MTTLKNRFLNELAKMYDAEQQIVKAPPNTVYGSLADYFSANKESS